MRHLLMPHTPPAPRWAVCSSALAVVAAALLTVPTASAATPGPATGASGSSAASSPQRAYVAVNVATVWTDPGKARPVDRPALTNPAHPRQWLRAMSSDQRADLTDSNRTQTQALYGARVLVLAQRGAWSQVVVPRQPTPRDPRGYPGWIPTVQLTRNPSYATAVRNHPFALLDRGTGSGLFAGPRLRHRVLTLSTNTRLPVLARTARALKVATPDDGAKWLPRKRATVHRSERAIPRPTGRQLVRTAKAFLHRPYVWAGRSAFGFDCSGLTGTVYQVHGITIPRDSGPQAQDPRARRVAARDLRAGDLLFYSHSRDAEDIYHVAMYVGNGRMIEAYDHLTPVRITRARLGGSYWGAVRYLHR
jgi:gamma-D-glutamyl-L-lysine dipeptidyl-peptidase